MAAYVLSGFFFHADFLSELIGFRLHAPINMLRDERHVLIIWIAVLYIMGVTSARFAFLWTQIFTFTCDS